MRRILMVYDRFVPFNVSGTPRVFHFAKELPKLGYLPTVLSTPVPDGFPRDDAPLAELPPEIEIVRTAPWLKRATRSSAGGGGAHPQKKSTRARLKDAAGVLGWAAEWYGDWLPPALRAGLKAIKAQRLELVWVSAPHIRNLAVGYALAERAALPLVVDLRDPWTYGSLWQPRDRLSALWEKAWAQFGDEKNECEI
jgi:hypothetical protein